jgi:tetratricopeptide (TPR) repeat protein
VIQPSVQEVAGLFRGELGWMFGPYPALVPESGWPSVGIFDALCRSMWGRADLSTSERVFVGGAAAHIGELVDACWRTFAAEVRVEHDGDVIVCAGKADNGANYCLPLEAAMLAVLRDPSLPQHPRVRLPFAPSRSERVLEVLSLTACLGASPFGKGTWVDLNAEGLNRRVDSVIPVLAASCADYYRRQHADERLGQKPDLYRKLIWPLTLCDGPAAYEEAGASLHAYLDGSLALVRSAVSLLENLARFPLESVRSAALVCLILDERVPVSDELKEIAADHVGHRASAYREAAISLSAERGRSIDWLNGGVNAASRFNFERQMGLLPLVHLPYGYCVQPANRELVRALVSMQAEEALRIMDRQLRSPYSPPRLLFQLAMLRRWLGDLEQSESLLQMIVRAYPQQLDAEFYAEAGAAALALGRLDDAITRLERSRALGGSRFWVELLLGRAYAEAGRSDDAVAVFDVALASGQKPSDVLVSRAEIHRNLGEQEGYARDLAAAAEVYPFNRRVVDKVLASYVEA